MKENRRDKIINKARELFNKNGYIGVSMRNIADELNISVGNLTYYFKKKEDLIEEVIVHKHKNYKKIESIEDLDELNNMFLTILGMRRDNAHYFDHYYQLSFISKKVYEIQLNGVRELKKIFLEGLKKLVSKGIVVEPPLSNHLENLVNSIMAIVISRPIKTEKIEIDEVKYISNCLWSIIFMNLTSDGQKKASKFII